MPHLGYARIDCALRAPAPADAINPNKIYSFKNMTRKQVRVELARREREAGRRGIRYYKWRRAVLERDSYACQDCGAKGTKRSLHAHHKLWWSKFPSLRFSRDNGKTLCFDCHVRIHPWLNWKRYKQLMKMPPPARPHLPKPLDILLGEQKGSGYTNTIFKIPPIPDEDDGGDEYIITR